MIPPKITQLPPAPVRADAPVDFSSKADAMVGALQPFADQANILAEFVNTRADNAAASSPTIASALEATIVVGFFRDFNINVRGVCMSDATISVEGLV